EFAQRQPADEPFRVLDAGSGVTYFPYFLCAQVPRAQVTCFDSNPAYHPMFDAVNGATPGANVKFVEGMLQKLPMADDSFDAVCCISVLEHTSNHGEILDEFARVLRPAGLLVVTFDLSLDGRFELPRAVAADLLSELSRKFLAPADIDLHNELAKMENPNRQGILTT